MIHGAPRSTRCQRAEEFLIGKQSTVQPEAAETQHTHIVIAGVYKLFRLFDDFLKFHWGFFLGHMQPSKNSRVEHLPSRQKHFFPSVQPLFHDYH